MITGVPIWPPGIPGHPRLGRWPIHRVEAWKPARVFPALFEVLCPAGCECAFCELFLRAAEQVLLDHSTLMQGVSTEAFGQ